MVVDPPQRQASQDKDRARLEEITHLSRKICGIWGTPELDIFLSRLITDSRDGARQGFPVEVAEDILFLAQTNKIIRAMDLARSQNIKLGEAYHLVDDGDQTRLKTDAMDDPTVSRDTVTRAGRPGEVPARRPSGVPARRAATPGTGSQAQGLRDLLLMLMRSKWLAWAIVLVLIAKFVWPTVKALL